MPLYFNPDLGIDLLYQDAQVAAGEVPAHYVLLDDEGKPTVSTNMIAAKQLMADTDWYVIRFQETGKEIPAVITSAREQARRILNP